MKNCKNCGTPPTQSMKGKYYILECKSCQNKVETPVSAARAEILWENMNRTQRGEA